MTITVEIPDEMAGALATPDKDPARAVLEAVALEGYRTNRLTEYQVQLLLGFETRLEVHGLLKENGAYLNYTMEELKHDMEEVRRYFVLHGADHPTGEGGQRPERLERDQSHLILNGEFVVSNRTEIGTSVSRPCHCAWRSAIPRLL